MGFVVATGTGTGPVVVRPTHDAQGQVVFAPKTFPKAWVNTSTVPDQIRDHDATARMQRPCTATRGGLRETTRATATVRRHGFPRTAALPAEAGVGAVSLHQGEGPGTQLHHHRNVSVSDGCWLRRPRLMLTACRWSGCLSCDRRVSLAGHPDGAAAVSMRAWARRRCVYGRGGRARSLGANSGHPGAGPDRACWLVLSYPLGRLCHPSPSMHLPLRREDSSAGSAGRRGWAGLVHRRVPDSAKKARFSPAIRMVAWKNRREDGSR